jgi:predicted DNA-binding protein
MDVQFAPEIEKQLNDLAAQSGRGKAELVQDAVAGYMSEVSTTRQMLDSRYDDIKSGRVQLMDGEDAFARLHASIQARRNRPA